MSWIRSFGSSENRFVDLKTLLPEVPELGSASHVVRILAENLLRNHAGDTEAAVELLSGLLGRREAVPFRPRRVIMQDAAGLPALLDIAGLRDISVAAGGEPSAVKLHCQADLVVDHSTTISFTGPGAVRRNLDTEYAHNAERYAFLRWAEQALNGLRIFPPGEGIIHQINLERIGAPVVSDGGWVIPDTVIGTDSHTPMINGLGVLGWGVGGLEATAAMLGNTIWLPPPRILGVRLSGRPATGTLITDIALRLTERLRRENVVECYLEFLGEGVQSLSVPDRATLSNMTPEYGASAALFPADEATIAYLQQTGRAEAAYLTREYLQLAPSGIVDDTTYERIIDFDLSEVRATVSGPSLPHQALSLCDVPATLPVPPAKGTNAAVLDHGSVVLAAITSCTNTSNPHAMVAAGLLARNAVRRGLNLPSHVRASFSPGSQSVPAYLDALGLLEDLETIGFWLVGFGCMTCVGNSGELDPAVASQVVESRLNVAAVLSGNRNFESRIHPLIRSNFLASPPLVIAYALAGTVSRDLEREPVAIVSGEAIFLRDIWPDRSEIDAFVNRIPESAYHQNNPAQHLWDMVPKQSGPLFPWADNSTYLLRPEVRLDRPKGRVLEVARALLILGDAVTTDHISPVGRIAADSPAGQYLRALGMKPAEFNTYGSRRGNAPVMRLGTFANPRLANVLADGSLGWITKHLPDGAMMTIPEAATRYEAEGTPLVIIAGENYGTGSARDWAAKGTRALGIRAVLARSFERIHRSNLILVGVLPVEWQDRPPLNGSETFAIDLPVTDLRPGGELNIKVSAADGRITLHKAVCRLDTPAELEIWLQGGLMAAAVGSVSNGL
jgi:aconitate hydratase